MKKFIVTEKQLNEYIKRKQEEKIFYSIVEDIYNNNKLLNENVSKKEANQTIIKNYLRKNLINNNIFKSLRKFHIINENNEII